MRGCVSVIWPKGPDPKAQGKAVVIILDAHGRDRRRIAGLPLIPSTGLSGGKKSPARLRPVLAANVPHVGSLSPNRQW